VLRIFASRDKRIVAAAPTGRAARRLSESTGHEAMTMHRLLEYTP
jgi:exodeoxyribonuclease V alpha subunit